MHEPWLIAIDIDGTLVHDDGYLAPEVIREVQRVVSLGHHVVVATGRAAANAIPVVRDVGITSGHVVCSNGAVTVEVDLNHHSGYHVREVIGFDPKPVLEKLIEKLPEAHFAVEDLDGTYRFHKQFPTYALGNKNIETPLDQLMEGEVSRVVVLSPEQDVNDFLSIVEQVGLHSVSYAIGYTAWLDIAPMGVTKSSALEQRRKALGIPQNRVIAIGDGRNDINMFEWANSGGGISFAMGQGPEEVKAAATMVTASVEENGVAQVLAGLEGIIYSQGS
ncbi:MAG: Cof-type HAD-IIB family hydrolase [Acidobacteria bacterium]|nr:Cof-type HAD-IIB family hydrolase [Acidobacteriota bacterium]NDC48185.1 HAD family hydrolase [Micrococcales bacterium]